MVRRAPQWSAKLGSAPSSGNKRDGDASVGDSFCGGDTTLDSTVCALQSQGLSSTPLARGGINRVDKDPGGRSRQLRPYCAPSCLLSLVNGQLLDSKCPNVQLYTQALADGHAVKHRISYVEWAALLRQQLSSSLVKGVVALNQEGAYSTLFQLTLLQYGYSFVAKGVTSRCVPVLQNEEAIYQKLQPLQGSHILYA